LMSAWDPTGLRGQKGRGRWLGKAEVVVPCDKDTIIDFMYT
jgi:hypothetical protein